MSVAILGASLAQPGVLGLAVPPEPVPDVRSFWSASPFSAVIPIPSPSGKGNDSHT